MRLGIVGCGDASLAIGLATRFVRRCSISVVCDVDGRRRERFARRFGATPVAEWQELLDGRLADAVYVAVPHDLHRELAAPLADAGLDVLLEKPLAATLADAGMLARGDAPGVVAVNYQYRFDPRVRALVGAARSGRLGEISHISVDVPWYRDEAYFRAAPWHASIQRAGGGTLLTQGSHALDVALLASGERPARACGRTYRRVHPAVEVEDLATGVVETESGLPIMITSSMVTRPQRRLSIAVHGSAGTVVYRGPSRPALRSRGVRVRAPFVLTQLHPYVASLAAFRDSHEGRPSAVCTAADALPVMRAVDALYRSAAEGRVVSV